MVSSQQGQTTTSIDMKANPALVSERQANLPLPSQPPVASDFNSADARTVNVGSGGLSSGSGSIGDVATGGTGREAKDGLSGIPNDAVTRDQKGHERLSDTTGRDYGYPGEKDPSSGRK